MRTESLGRSYLALPDGTGPFPGAVVVHEASGLNDNIRLPFVGDQRELVVLCLPAVGVDLFHELLVGGLGPGRPRPVQQPGSTP